MLMSSENNKDTVITMSLRPLVRWDEGTIFHAMNCVPKRLLRQLPHLRPGFLVMTFFVRLSRQFHRMFRMSGLQIPASMRGAQLSKPFKIESGIFNPFKTE